MVSIIIMSDKSFTNVLIQVNTYLVYLTVVEAGLDGKVLSTFDREDLNDLMPGPTMFLARRKLWDVIIGLKVCNIS
jgi:hypothetical protein